MPACFFTLWRDAIRGMIWTKFAVMVVAHDKFFRQGISMTTDFIDVTDMSPAAHRSVGGQEMSNRRGGLVMLEGIHFLGRLFIGFRMRSGRLHAGDRVPKSKRIDGKQITVTNFVETKLRL